MNGPTTPLAVVGATIIDGTGSQPIEDGVLLIDGKKIVAVGDGSMTLPERVQRISAAGKYVIPGLMDANVHLVADTSALTMVRHEGRYDELAIEAAQVALRSGVTTLFDSWGPRKHLIKARDAVNQGHVVASRIYLAGNIVGFGGPFSEDFDPRGREVLSEEYANTINAIWQENVGPELMWMSPEQVRREIRKYIQGGIDFLKFAVTVHSPVVPHIAFSPRVQRVIVDEAHRAGIPVQTHTTSVESLHLAIEADVDLMQHIEITGPQEVIPPETVDLLVQRRMPGAFLAQTEKVLEWHRQQGSDAFHKIFAIADRNERALLRAGAVVLLSTDGGVFCSNVLHSALWKRAQPPEEGLLLLGEGHFNWLLAVEQKGMPAMAALMAATSNIARAYRVDDILGTLQKGKVADLVILDKNPLESATHYRSISLIMKEGSIVDRDCLPTVKLLTERALHPSQA